VLARYSPIRPLDDERTDFLITHLRRYPADLSRFSKFGAERFAADLISEALGCEVRKVGGRKDEGVDAFIVRGEDLRSVIQVKWRDDINRAEGVKVVREVAGTMLFKGVPGGIIVSNRKYFSKQARKEAKAISSREVSGIGKLQLDLVDYDQILGMLELASTKLTSDMTIQDWMPRFDPDYIFDGAMKIRYADVKQWLP